MPIDALSELCAQLTRDLLAIAKFLLRLVYGLKFGNAKRFLYIKFILLFRILSVRRANVITFLSASLYFSKEALIEIGCVVTSLVVGWLVVTRVHCGQTVQAYSYYGTLIGNPTPGIQWYKFRPPGVTPSRGIGPP